MKGGLGIFGVALLTLVALLSSGRKSKSKKRKQKPVNTPPPSGPLTPIPTTPPAHSGQRYLFGPEREARFGPPGAHLLHENVAELEHTGRPLVSLHERAMPSFLAVMQDLNSLGLTHLIKTNDGTFNNRDVRGKPGLKSSHAYGTAIDLNASENPLGGSSTPDQNQLAHVFKRHGWFWGGWFPTRPDPQHFEFLGDIEAPGA